MFQNKGNWTGTGYSDGFGVECETAQVVLGLGVLELMASLCDCCRIQLVTYRERGQGTPSLVRAGLVSLLLLLLLEGRSSWMVSRL